VTLTWNFYSLILIISFYQSFNSFFHLFQQIVSDSSSLHLPKSFCSILSLSRKVHWSKNLCYSSFSFSSPFAKKNSTTTNRLNSFCVSLLPFPKEWRTNRLNSFVSPFSIFKEFKRTQFENSFDSSLSLKQNISKD